MFKLDKKSFLGSFNLTPSQAKAIEEIDNFINDPVSCVHCLSGSPGTGKSYLIKNIIRVLASQNFDVKVTATTNKAASVIGGVTVNKLFSFGLKVDYATGIQRIDTSRADKDNLIHNREFIIIDEVSMLNRELWETLNKYCYECKFLLVGDKYQLPAVRNGINVFDEYSVSELTDVVRQKDPEFIKEIESLKDGVINNTIKNIKPNACIEFVQGNQVVDVLKKFTNKDKVLCYTNKEVLAYIEGMRKLKNETPEPQVGDAVRAGNYCESFTDKTVINSQEELEISYMSEPELFEYKHKTVTVKRVNFVGVEGTFYMACDYNEFQNVLKYFSKFKTTEGWEAYYKFAESILDLRTDEACTVHCSQGSTYDNVYIDLRDIDTCRAYSTKARLLYVAVSRAKNHVYIYKG